ncbi:MAG: hypothetical protein JMN25_11250 [gamma proteobacterium endosymbiont of Lamellibrachia anaximandri]|nr:hypothetical protein [gamma proteobacterium endosymbiont of Lamellibrachia anaximandri]
MGDKTVTLMYASDQTVINSKTIDDDEWKFKEYDLAVVPCSVRAVQSDGMVAEKRVKHAPADCDTGDTGGGTPPPVVIPPPVGTEVSINSTSQNGTPGIPVAEQPLVNQNGYKIFAINDLGMHCGDLDTRVSSILPPFNVLHATVILVPS